MSYGLHTKLWLRLESGFFPIFSASHIIIFSLWYPNITCSLTVTYSDIPCLHTHICFPFLGKTLHWRPYLYLLNSHLTNFNHVCILWRPLRTLNLTSRISKAYRTWSFQSLAHFSLQPIVQDTNENHEQHQPGAECNNKPLHFRLPPHLPNEQ